MMCHSFTGKANDSYRALKAYHWGTWEKDGHMPYTVWLPAAGLVRVDRFHGFDQSSALVRPEDIKGYS